MSEDTAQIRLISFQGCLRSDPCNQFDAAFARAQSKFEDPRRLKTAGGVSKSGKEMRYNYADLAEVIRCARPALNAEGIGYRQHLISNPGDKSIGVVTILTHSSGQFECSEIAYPMPQGIQDAGKVATYLRRYALGAALGLAPEDDDDAQSLRSKREKTSLPPAANADRRDRADRPTRPDSAPRTGRPAEVVAEGPEPASEDHPGRKALADQLSARFAGDKMAANKWLRSRSGGRSWKQLTAEDLQLLLDQVETVGHADQAETPAEAPAEEPANQDAEVRRRKAAQRAWGTAAGKCGLTKAEVYWYMGSAFGWVTDPDKGRPSANATPIPQIEAAIHALNSLTPDEVDKIKSRYAFWLDDQNHGDEE